MNDPFAVRCPVPRPSTTPRAGRGLTPMLNCSGARCLQLQDGLVAWALGAPQGVCFAGAALPVEARVPQGRPSLFHDRRHANHLIKARVRTIAGGVLKPWTDDFSLQRKPMVGMSGGVPVEYALFRA